MDLEAIEAELDRLRRREALLRHAPMDGSEGEEEYCARQERLREIRQRVRSLEARAREIQNDESEA